MKTVMKKLMSLLLVAVLLVSAVPFQASASTGEGTSEGTSEGTGERTGEGSATTYTITFYNADGSAAMTSVTTTGALTNEQIASIDTIKTNNGLLGWASTANANTADANLSQNFTADTSFYAVNPTPVCAHCNESHETTACERWLSCCENLDTHKTTCSTLPCTTDGCEKNNHPSTELHSNQCASCRVIGGGHESTCPTQKCTTSGCEKNNHATTEPHSFETQCEGCKVIFNKNDAHCTVCHEAHTVSNCPYCATCYTNSNGQDKITTHKAGDHCGYCSGVGGKHAADCFTLATKYDLNVYVRRKVGEYVKDTVLLNTYTVEKDTPIVKFVLSKEAELQGLIDSKLGSDHYWTTHIYNFEGTELNATDTILSANGERNVYINAYGKESEILIYVHLNGSATTDRIAALHGYDTRVDKDVSYNAVLARVQEFYGTGISMTMYSATGWADKLAGNTNTSAGSTVSLNTSGVTKIHVSISGGTTNRYTADSTNPKTGDEIFMAVTTLAVSASALALCFYFKKKRTAK